jgi:hypothetical protein
MALMYPNRPPESGPGKKAEGVLYEALKQQLPGDFHVYYGFRFIEEEHAREGEVDFLVVHREMGMLALECKGYGVKRTASGEWLRTLEGGAEEPLRKSPFEQAEGHIHSLVKALGPKVSHQLSWKKAFPMPFGYAVIFPLTHMTDGRLPMEAPKEIVFDSSDMPGIGMQVQGAMRFWAKARPADAPQLDDRDFERFRRHILLPKLKFVVAPGAAIAAEEGALIQLTQEQNWVADALTENRLFRIVGGAGTGKTVLALEVARRLAAEGRKTLVLCFNEALATKLEAVSSVWGFEADRVRSTYFHRLCNEAYQVLGEAFTEPIEEAARGSFYNHEAPERLYRALEGGLLPKWDAVVVDEGQDFAASWWHIVETRLSNAVSGTRFVFYDPYQGIFGRECSVPDYPQLRLKQGVRSTRQITQFSAALGDPELVPHFHCPEGTPIEIHKVQTPSECRQVVFRMISRLIKNEGFAPEQIVVLSAHRPEHSSLAGITEIDGTLLSPTLDLVPGVIRHTTIRKFKGLESEAVILIDSMQTDPLCDSSARYVAVSRAKHFLGVLELNPS